MQSSHVTLDPHADHILLQGIRNREDTAFKYLQVKFEASIRLMVLEMGGSREDARDMFNEGIVALIQLVDREDFRLTCKLGTLLYALCNKKWKQQLEKRIAARNYHLKRLDNSEDADFSENADEALYHEIFWECFGKLGKVCRDILEGYLKEVSPKELAQSLGYSYGYVRKKKSLCHNYLIRLIEHHHIYRRIKKSEEVEVE